jgi:hypothetical protein
MKRTHSTEDEEDEEDEDDALAELILAHQRVFDLLRSELESGTSASVSPAFLTRTHQWLKRVSKDSWLTLEWEDMDRDLAMVETERNLASDLPPWAPIDMLPMLAIKVFRLDERVRGSGLGRYALNAFTQSLARNARLPHMLFVDQCHFPLFFTLDSYYGWLRLEDIPPETPAGLIYPRYWPAKTPREVAANSVATYAFTDLLWSTPVRVARARVGATKPWLASELHPLLARLNDTLATLTLTQAHCIEGLEWVLSVAPLAQALAGRHTALVDAVTDHSALVDAVTDHCLSLGYSDPTGATVMALAFGPSLLQSDKLPMPEACAQLILAYCVDHCRVLYRPIVLGNVLVERLNAALGVDDPSDWFCESDPWHAPHFERLGKDRWLWVPVKKPHSTTYDGTTYVPPPRCETPPLFVETLAHERPAKQQRTKRVSCLHCSAPILEGTLRGPGVAFCRAECSRLYYL